MTDVNLWLLFVPIGVSLVIAAGGHFISMSRVVGVVEGKVGNGTGKATGQCASDAANAAASAAASAATAAAGAAATAASAAATSASVHLEALKRIEQSVGTVDKKIDLVMENWDKLCVQKHLGVDKAISSLETRMEKQEGK